MAGYVLDNGWERERERLAALESVYDPGTTRYLDAIGVRRGFTCLEVGGGGGSVASWLCRRVGPEGKVVATDIDPCFLDALDEPNLVVLHHDIAVDDLPEAAFDVVHARLLLEHLPEHDKVLERLVGALKPGGAILVEDLDWRILFVDPPAVQVQPPADAERAVRVWRAVVDTMSEAGYDRELGSRLADRMIDLGLEDVTAETRGTMYRGGSPDAVVPHFTLEQLRDRILAARRLNAGDIEWAIERLQHPEHRMLLVPMISTWGRRPVCPAEPIGTLTMTGLGVDLRAQLSWLPLFAGCSPAELSRVAGLCAPLEVDRGTTIVEEGQPGDRFYVLLTGRATVRARRRKLATLGPGSFFGETALLTGGPRTATVKADTPLRLAVFDRDAFDRLLRDSPTTARAVLEGVAARRPNPRPVLWP
jgi:2-polyprenyl-3-methyl-5-hydroxy-6-metoxy-1,4-benzoquinol methylase